MTTNFYSIDQNSHSLWDTIPKLAALAQHNWHGTHFVEDIDVAFTRHGDKTANSQLQIQQEAIRRDGSSDWGAALFYTDFLGRSPLNLHDLKKYIGWSSAAIARKLEINIDQLFAKYSISDNWQLIGSSYTNTPACHRVIGDLDTKQIAPYLQKIIQHAHNNLLETFPQNHAQTRINNWFISEQNLLNSLLTKYKNKKLIHLYQAWTKHHLPKTIKIDFTSTYFTNQEYNKPFYQLINHFLNNYQQLATLYNQAIIQSKVGLNQLRTKTGDLPIFAVIKKQGILMRTSLRLQDNTICAGEFRWSLNKGANPIPLAAMQKDGVTCLVGKALLLILQARFKPHGSILALPYLGSLYLPAAKQFEKLLQQQNLLPAPTNPIYRIKFNTYNHWQNYQTTINLPQYLHETFNCKQIQTKQFKKQWTNICTQIKNTLQKMQNEKQRETILSQKYPKLYAQRKKLNQQRQIFAKNPQTRPQAKILWDKIKPLDEQILKQQYQWLVNMQQTLNLEYYNSRGAIMPWSIAIGGKQLYQQILQQAEIYQER